MAMGASFPPSPDVAPDRFVTPWGEPVQAAITDSEKIPNKEMDERRTAMTGEPARRDRRILL